MPIFRTGDQLHYFAHVPKCAGTAVEAYLAARFGSLAFLNPDFMAVAEADRWSKSTPQHMPAAEFLRLIPRGWITSSFAVVRHPLTRLISAYRYHVLVAGRDPAVWSVDDWFADWLAHHRSDPFRYDGHLRLQCDLVPDDATVFPLEQGLDGIVAHLDRLSGKRSGPRDLAVMNEGRYDTIRFDGADVPQPETLAAVADFYADDFTRFGYDPDGMARPDAPRAPVISLARHELRRPRTAGRAILNWLVPPPPGDGP